MISLPRDTVLITGSSGLIGRSLVERLAGQYNVVGLDLLTPDHLPEHTSFIPIDLSSDQSVANALSQVHQQHGNQIASVIHLAAYYDFAGEPSEKYQTITVQGTHRLLREVQQFAKVEQLVFSSTMLVHAPCNIGERINEDSPLDPKWDYPKSKVETEQLILSEHGDIPVVLMRIAGVYSEDGDSIPLSQQMQRIYERRMTGRVYPGDTRSGQALIHLDDLVEAFARVVDRRNSLPSVTTLLIGEPDTMSYEQLQREFGDLIHGESWPTQRVPKTVARTGAWFQEKIPVGEDPFIKPWMIALADDHYELDISRARHLLDWEPQHNVHDTLPAMVHSMKTDPLQWYQRHKIDPPDWVVRNAKRQRSV